ncbi:MAG: hypothetical protein KC503_35750 [Myxococcales bacterium]|nr:hypothetical protein [Myxococcales bacterium]
MLQHNAPSTVHYPRMRRLGSKLLLLLAAASLVAACGKPEAIDYSQAELTAATDTATVTNTLGRFLVGIEEPAFDLSGTTDPATVRADYLQLIRDGADKLQSPSCRVTRSDGVDGELETVRVTLDSCSWLFGVIRINGTYVIGVKTDFKATSGSENTVTVKVMLEGFTINALQLDGMFEVTRSPSELTMSLSLETPTPKLSLVASGNVMWSKPAGDTRTCMMVNAFGGISSLAGKIVGSFTDVKVCDGAAKGPCPEQGTLTVVGRRRHVVRLAPGSAQYQRDDNLPRDLPACRQ